MRQDAKRLSELVAPYDPFPQVLVNVPVKTKPLLADIPEVANALAQVEQDLGLDGRVLLRYSGTEPLLRVMVEGPDPEQIQSHAQLLAGLISARVG
jgi:phosphoglucosamine mutase